MSDLPDIHSTLDTRGISVKVGLDGISAPISIEEKGRKRLHRVDAKLRCVVLLDSDKKGTHLSRIVRALKNRPTDSGTGIISNLLRSISGSLESEYAYVSYDFEYPAYCNTRLYGWYKAPHNALFIAHRVTLPVITVCPCSLELNCGTAAHVQRCYISASVLQGTLPDRIWYEDLVDALQKSGSGNVQDVVRRTDEKEIVSSAFKNPKFAEDVVRDSLINVRSLSNVAGVYISVRSQESIHPFDVIASAQYGLCPREFIMEA